ncbi:hypothetical protein PVT67_03875 [Gallaecimonas kandeliae]|uniref:hypothetical protein n=1 Tax=Gallaecimonas kandeliae TaxID=3029055 RepID=UPI0026485011|nr:hypothetical protein [Gallaecimonas kandeliae]WKE66400.1 hypothetical protein PVT67_03875 [Gallaecimonas kandeliae]
MKAYFTVLKHYFASVPLQRWISYLGLALLAASLLPFDGARVIRIAGMEVLFFIPVIMGGYLFRQLVSNPRLTLAPNARQASLLALVTVALLAALAATWLKPQAAVFGWSLLAISSYLLLSQWAICYRFGSLLFFWAMMFVSHLLPDKQDPQLQALFHDGWPLALLLALAAWTWLYWWLPRQRKLRQPLAFKGGLAQAMTKDKDAKAVSSYGDPVLVMLLGGKAGLGRAFFIYTLLFFGFPAFLGLVLCLQSWSLAPVLELLRDPDGVFMFLLYGVLMAPMVSLDPVARLRYLWLRLPGDRHSLWQRLDDLLRRQALIGSVLLAAATFVIGLSVQAAPRTLLIMALCGCSYLWAMQLLVCWLRQRHWPGLAAVLAGLTLMGLSLGLGIHWYITGTQAWLAPTYNLLLGLLARQGVKHSLLGQDWIRLKPRRLQQWQRGF